MEGLRAGVECDKKLHLPLSVGFPLAPHWNPCPRVRECWRKGVHAGCQLVSATAEVLAVSAALPVQAPAIFSLTQLRCSLRCKSSSSFSISHCHQPPPPSFPLWSHSPGQAGPAWTLNMYQGMSCGGVAALRDLGCLWCASWGSTNDGLCHSTQACPSSG